jgi:transposase
METVTAPPIVQISVAEVQALLDRLQPQVAPGDYQMVDGMARTIQLLDELLERRDLTLAKLRQMIFGVCSERLKDVFPERAAAPPGEASSSIGLAAASREEPQAAPEKRKGHGRNGAEDYAGAQHIPVPLPGMMTGCACPKCQRGKVYRMEAGSVVRIVGRPALQARIYEPERWRCNLCDEIFTAPLPPEAGDKKYDETAGSMIALLKYGSGVPFYRLQGLQESLQVPLAAATQWEIVAEVAKQATPVWEALLTEAAQGAVLHNDDTTMTVLSLKEENDGPEAPERKGVFTSGIVSVREGWKAGMFFTGRKHAGERLEELLQRRAAELGSPIQMCDALERNLPKAFKVILSNCLAHGRRKFVEQAVNFPAESRHVLDRLAEVYRYDELAKEHGLDPEQRLAFHQANSGPIMESLRLWLQTQWAEKKVEPNSGLGQAIGYMLKRWDPLTLFLRQAGAPLDNNICEQALKMTILHRKNALFYKTENGARVGDILMSLIHTCRLNDVNPFDYLTAIQKHAEQVRTKPAKWLPWNYQEQLKSSPTDTG